jgi:hypothetical protein
MQVFPAAAQRRAKTIDVAESCIARRPEYVLAGAFALGVLLGWWIKKR